MLSIFKNILPTRIRQPQICLSKLMNYSTGSVAENNPLTLAEKNSSTSTGKIAESINSPSVESSTESIEQPEKDKLYSRLEIEIKGVDPAVLKSYSWFATTSAEYLGIQVGNCWALRKAKHDRLTLLKSVHIYKKHRVQYEIRSYFRYMHFHKLTGSTLGTFLEYIERNLPEGVALKATKVELQNIPEHLTEPPAI